MEKNITINTKETQSLGNKIAKDILKSGVKSSAVVLCLQGELGAGKTTFLQGFAKGLGIKEKILSPTFVIMKRFEIKKSSFKNFYHIDCYRMNNLEDAKELGLKEIMSNPYNIVALEWPERIKDILPESSIYINLNVLDKDKREIVFNK